MRFVKRTLSAFLALVMVFTMLPLQVWASEMQQSGNESVTFAGIVDDKALEPEETKVDTYIFEVDGEEVSKQYVKDGEAVYAPEAPAKEGYKFMGWFEDGTQFAAGPAANVQGMQHTYTARYQQVYYVFFMDGIGENPAVVHTQEGVPGDAIDTAFTFNAGPDSGVEGWYYNRELTQKVQPDETIQDQNITLYPKVQTGHWLRFDSNGGTPVDSIFMLPGAKTEKPTEPTREGFQFLHWETEAGEEFQFGSELTESVTLKAKWQGDTVNYKVFYWVENADDEDYSLVNTVDKKGIAGEPAVNPGDTLQLPEGYPDKNLANAVHYNAEKTGEEAAKTIAGDGSTIVNVYYDRNVYTIYFYDRGYNRGDLICKKEEHSHTDRCYEKRYGWLGIPYYELICGKENHTHGDGCYAIIGGYAADPITGKYGASLKKMGKHWPTNTEGGNNWSTNNEGVGPYQANIETIPAQNMSFWVPEKPESNKLVTHTAYYYVEVLDGEQDGTVVEGKKYKKYDEVSVLYYPNGHGSRLTVSEQDRYPIQGFTINEADSTRNGALYNGAMFYYTRNRYNLRLVNTANEGPHSIQYEAPLKDYLEDPQKPANVGEEFTFQGWYRDENYKQPFDSEAITTMPAGSLTLYAKWDAPKFTVTVHLGMGVDSGEPLTITVPYGGKINPNDLPEIELPEGVESYSWATYRDGKYLSFDLDTPLYQDVTIYPYWISNQSFRVRYDLNGGTGEVNDSRLYRDGADAEVLGLGSDVQKPHGKVFLGWKAEREGDDNIYQPGDKIQIQNADVILTAEWGDQAVKTSLTYHANDDTGKTESFEYNNNEKVKLKTADDLGFTREGYEFLGWAVPGNATNPDYPVGGTHTVVVNNSEYESNDLYAVWKQTVKQGDPIKVRVLMDDKQVNAKDYVSVIPVSGTESLKISGGIPTYTLGYTYKDLNCADFNLSVTVPEGYSVAVTADKPGPTGDAVRKIEGEGASWTLDNIPGGATVTVSLTKQMFTVNYVAGEGGTVSRPNETVPYGDNAQGSTATPNEGYYFVEWKNADGVQVSTNAAFTPEGAVTENATYTAVFAQQKEITVKAKDLSKVYDGTAIEADSAQLETIAGELDEGHRLIVTTTVSKEVINVSDTDGKHQIENCRIVDRDGNDVTNQYSVTTQDGALTILPKPVTVTITGNQETKIYNGSEQFVTGYQVEIPNDSGYTEGSITFEGEAIAKGTNADTYYMGLTKDDFDNTDTNYNVTFEVYDGHLTIEPVTDEVVVTIVGNHNTVTYTGSEQEVIGFNVAVPEGSLYKPEYVALADGKEAKASGTNVNTYYMGLTKDSFQNTSKNFTNVKFVVTDGYLKINPATMTLSAVGYDEKYDGGDHGGTVTALEGATLTYSTDGGMTWEPTAPTVENVADGTITVKVKATLENYQDAETTYTLNVQPRNVTLTSGDDIKPYGQTAENENVTVSGDGFVAGEGVTCSNFASLTLVGSKPNTFDYTLNEGTEERNYIIEQDYGTLKVTAPKDFDYVQKDANNEKFAIGEKVTFTITVTNIYDVEATVQLNEQKDMTFEDGKTELTDEIPAGKTKTYTVYHKVTEADVEAGEIKNKVTWTLTPDGGSEIPGTDEEIIQNLKYKVSYGVSGETPVDYTPPVDAEYPIGKSVEVAAVPSYPGYTFTGWTAPEGITVTEGKFAMPEKDVTLTGVFALAGDTKYKVEHYFAELNGKYPVTPNQTETKTGTTFAMTQAQPIPEAKRTGYVVADGWANEQIQPDGSTVIKIYYEREVYNISWETSGEPAGQEQTFETRSFLYGADISEVENPEVKQFDGYTWSDWSKTTLPETMPAEDIVITGSYTPIDYKVTYQLAEGSETPENYTVPVDTTKYYIGDIVTVVADAQAPGYNFEGWYTEDGAKVTVGKDDPTFTMPAGDVTLYGKFSKRTDLAYTVNYIWNGTVLETVLGTGTFGDPIDPEVKDFEGYTFKDKQTGVTITADATKNVVNVYYYKNVTLTAKNEVLTYNGETQTAEPGYVSSETNAVFDGIVPTGSGKNAKEYPIAFPENTHNTVDKNKLYIVTDVKDGTLTINKRQVALESESGEQVYNGKALTKPDVIIGDVKFVEGDAEVKATGTQTLVGESKNTIEITWKDETVAGNYEITKTEGTLKVTAPENLNEYVVKTHEGQNFKVGDTVTFKITVTNIYAVDATVKLEEMAGMTFGNGQTALEDDLDPGQTKTYTATRTLTDADFENGGVSNTVKVTLTPVDGETGIPGTDTDEVELEEKPDMSVVKSVVDPKESYRVGDTIQYQITVTNTGNVTLHDLRLTDVMNADGKVTFPAGTALTKDTLAVDATWTVRCSYVVREADEGKVISNKATVIAHDPETKDPEKEAGDTTDGEQVQNLYSLTIHYRNGAGTAVAPSFQGRYHAGDQWKVVSPIVAGYYEPHIRSISSDESGMPAKDLVYVVTYAAIPAPVDPDPERPNPNPSEPDEEDDETVPTTMPETELPPEPADFTVDPDDYTLTEVEDNETPLANMDLDGHTCCIMHLLLMLAAMVVLGFYTKSRKKHQARIFELKRILAAEEDHPDDPQQP